MDQRAVAPHHEALVALEEIAHQAGDRLRAVRAGLVPRALESVLAQACDEDFEVIVVNDRSTDRTGEILAALAKENPRLAVIAGSEPPAGWLRGFSGISEGFGGVSTASSEPRKS